MWRYYSPITNNFSCKSSSTGPKIGFRVARDTGSRILYGCSWYNSEYFLETTQCVWSVNEDSHLTMGFRTVQDVKDRICYGGSYFSTFYASYIIDSLRVEHSNSDYDIGFRVVFNK